MRTERHPLSYQQVVWKIITEILGPRGTVLHGSYRAHNTGEVCALPRLLMYPALALSGRAPWTEVDLADLPQVGVGRHTSPKTLQQQPPVSKVTGPDRLPYIWTQGLKNHRPAQRA